MRNKKVSRYIGLGLLLNSLKHIFTIPEDWACFISGLSISLIIMGLYMGNRDMTSFKIWKRTFLKRILKLN